MPAPTTQLATFSVAFQRRHRAPPSSISAALSNGSRIGAAMRCEAASARIPLMQDAPTAGVRAVTVSARSPHRASSRPST